MTKKELIIPFISAGLGLAFAIISIAVFLTHGKSKKWIARKMRIGGLLLSITAASCNGGGGEVTCYEAAEINSMWINPTSTNVIEIRLDTSNVLSGLISTIDGKDFSFSVSDSLGKKYQKGIIQIDTAVGYSKNFTIELDKALKPGKYRLKLYTTSIAAQDTTDRKREFNLVIKGE